MDLFIIKWSRICLKLFNDWIKIFIVGLHQCNAYNSVNSIMSYDDKTKLLQGSEIYTQKCLIFSKVFEI